MLQGKENSHEKNLIVRRTQHNWIRCRPLAQTIDERFCGVYIYCTKIALKFCLHISITEQRVQPKINPAASPNSFAERNIINGHLPQSHAMQDLISADKNR